MYVDLLKNVGVRRMRKHLIEAYFTYITYKNRLAQNEQNEDFLKCTSVHFADVYDNIALTNILIC